MDVSNEDATREALRRVLDALARDPERLDAELAASARLFPEGDLLPLTLAVVAGEERFIDRAIAVVERRVGDLLALADMGSEGTYVAHLAFALASLRAPTDRQRAIFDHLVELLITALEARGGAPIDSYPDQRWPIDTVVALHAIRADERAPALIDAHLEWTSAHLDSESGLPISVFDETAPRPPRGSDLSWRIVLLADLDQTFATETYARYVERFWIERGMVAGFAEGDRGSRTRSDADSGPIFEGIGATASAFGIATCAALDDVPHRRRLIRQLALGRALVEQSHGERVGGIPIDARYVTGFLMGDATLLYALTRE